MQHHNYKIYSDVKILNDNNIKVYSIKTDALTVHKNDIDKIKSLLNFSTDKIKYYSDLSKKYLQSYNEWFVDKSIQKMYKNALKYPIDQVKGIAKFNFARPTI